MYTAIDVYHAPQTKNWRNIIVDSLVRITASGRDREFLRQPDDDVRSCGEHDVRILGLRRDTRAGDAAHHAADDRALLIAADHASQHRTGNRAGADLRGVARRDAPTL